MVFGADPIETDGVSKVNVPQSAHRELDIDLLLNELYPSPEWQMAPGFEGLLIHKVIDVLLAQLLAAIFGLALLRGYAFDGSCSLILLEELVNCAGRSMDFGGNF